MEVKNAIRAAAPIKNGSTRPYYLICDDGCTYAVKFKQNPQGSKAIVNEYICSEMAKILELPIPDPILVNVTDDFLTSNGEKLSEFVGDTILPGTHFGTKKIKKAFSIEQSSAIGSMLDFATNLDVISEIFIFDLFICNKDRDSNGGNLLFDATSNQIVILDHTHVFDLGTIWECSQLNMRIGEPFKLINPEGFVYRRLVPYVVGRNPFGKIINKLNGMTYDQISHIINNIPAEWEITNDEKNALINYLVDRKNRIEEVLPLLKPYMPRWKGGP